VSQLFETTQINGLALKNRFVRSATWTGLSQANGKCSMPLIDMYVRLAKGGAGLLITGHAYVQKKGQAGPWQLGIHNESILPGLRSLVNAVHENGAKIVIQLSHAGIYANAKLTGTAPFAISDIKGVVPYPVKEMASEDFDAIIECFVKSALMAKAAGFDGIQLHAAHGYLISQSLSPAYNIRKDQYGGSIENRSLLLLTIVQKIRKTLGNGYPILVKLNSQDFLNDGLKLNDAIKIACLLEKEVVDAIEISGGTRASGDFKSSRTGILADDHEAYFQEAARLFKVNLNIPIILVGGIRSYHVAERLVNSKSADYIAMCRPLIREPELINRWESGDDASTGCISCNGCLAIGLSGKGVRCKRECLSAM